MKDVTNIINVGYNLSITDIVDLLLKNHGKNLIFSTVIENLQFCMSHDLEQVLECLYLIII